MRQLLPAILLALAACTTTPEFNRLAHAPVDAGGVYLIRPSGPILAPRGIQIEIFKYPGDVRDGNAVRLRELSLGVGQYAFFRLYEGYYKLRVTNRDGDEQIISVKAGELSFFSIESFHPSLFSLPAVRLKNVDRKQAGEILIGPAGRMHAHPDSQDFSAPSR